MFNRSAKTTAGFLSGLLNRLSLLSCEIFTQWVCKNA